MTDRSCCASTLCPRRKRSSIRASLVRIDSCFRITRSAMVLLIEMVEPASSGGTRMTWARRVSPARSMRSPRSNGTARRARSMMVSRISGSGRWKTSCSLASWMMAAMDAAEARSEGGGNGVFASRMSGMSCSSGVRSPVGEKSVVPAPCRRGRSPNSTLGVVAPLKIRSVDPRRTRSPGLRRVGSPMRRSLTNVPFFPPASRTKTPSACLTMAAWVRETPPGSTTLLDPDCHVVHRPVVEDRPDQVERVRLQGRGAQIIDVLLRGRIVAIEIVRVGASDAADVDGLVVHHAVGDEMDLDPGDDVGDVRTRAVAELELHRDRPPLLQEHGRAAGLDRRQVSVEDVGLVDVTVAIVIDTVAGDLLDR